MKQTYKQEWKKYDKRKSNEYEQIHKLIKKVLRKVERRIHQRQIRAILLKEYHRTNNRNVTSIIRQNTKHQPCHKTISNYYNNDAITPILQGLIHTTSLPFKKIEVTAALDSTGFSTKRYITWNKFKWGKKTGKERVWIKLHALTGTITNTIIHAIITPKDTSDITILEPIISNNLKKFKKIKDFVADKAYLSRDAYYYIQNKGMTPYIPFKKNSVGTPLGVAIWREMHTHFMTSPDEYNNAYHTRSNAETVFHMIKTRFGNSIKSKNYTAQENEILGKCLLHNLCVLTTEGQKL